MFKLNKLSKKQVAVAEAMGATPLNGSTIEFDGDIAHTILETPITTFKGSARQAVIALRAKVEALLANAATGHAAPENEPELDEEHEMAAEVAAYGRITTGEDLVESLQAAGIDARIVEDDEPEAEGTVIDAAERFTAKAVDGVTVEEITAEVADAPAARPVLYQPETGRTARFGTVEAAVEWATKQVAGGAQPSAKVIDPRTGKGVIVRAS